MPIYHNNLTAAQQYFALRSNRIFEGEGKLYCNKLIWEVAVQPTPLAREYRLKIMYKQGDIPQVYLIEPDIRSLAGGRPLPHVYCENPVRLCLYLPGGNEWLSSMKISDTLIPWAILWLWYFEDWLISNEWKGGGKHPVNNN